MQDISNFDHNSIAIIGMASRFPGARDVHEFWRNLSAGVESIKRLTDEQLRRAGAADAELRNPAYVKAAAILDDIDLFDAAFFGFSPKDAAIMDPQHRVFLECAWHALENAGCALDQFEGRIGVYAGSGMNAYLIHNLLANRKLVDEAGLFVLKQTGNDKDVLATRLSYQLNLTGPSLAVQTACSTSLVAVHLASQALLSGECDIALAGGVTVEIPHGRGYVYREGEILSRDGHCRPFDSESSGTIFASGAGIVVLRRLEDSIRDGDSIWAIIRGTAINNDGSRKVGFLAPSVAGQAEVIAEAQAAAGIDADSISYVEAHGTGTRVGDPIEVEALTRAFRASTDRRGFCAIGSLKSNVGHLDAAAGVAGLIKTTLALKHRQIPPTLNFSQPNPLIDFAESPFFVARTLRDWNPQDKVRRAGVTSLGIGGTNAHVVLEEAPPAAASAPTRNYELLTISARTRTALDAMSRNFADYLDAAPAQLADVAFTSHLGRTALPYRRPIVCRDFHEAAQTLRARVGAATQAAQEIESAVVFLFPGQGAQYPGMARALYDIEPEFRSVVDQCSEFLRPYLGLDLTSVIFAAAEGRTDAESVLAQTQFTQPALLVIEYALAQLWISLGIRPAAMIGHSVGEFAAACVAGVYTLEDTLRIVAERGRLMQSLPGGTMTAIVTSENDVRPLLDDRCALASVNAADQCVAAGPEDAIAALEAQLTRRQLRHRRLKVSHAFHSPMMDPIVEPFAEFVGRFRSNPATLRWVSSATGTWIGASEAGQPDYWARQLRGTVRFSDGASTLLKAGAVTFLETGPGHTLSSLIEQHADFPSSARTLNTLPGASEDVSAEATFLHALGQLWASGAKVDWRRYHRAERRNRVELPAYPFERRRYWIDPDPPGVINQFQDSRKELPASSGLDLFRPQWKEAELPTPSDSASVATGPWLIFADDRGLGDRSAAILRDRGEHVTIVRAATEFARPAHDEFRIAAHDRSQYEQLMAALLADSHLPRRILHLWNILDSIPQSAELEELDRVTEVSFWSILFLAQALAPELDAKANCRCALVSNDLAAPEGETIERPERAMLTGPCGVIPKELPELQLQHIDVAMPADGTLRNGNRERALTEIARQVLVEIDAGVRESPVAYRRGRRFRLTHERLTRAQSPIELRDGDVHLITGGLGGIGLTLAEAIAQSSKARLVLLARKVLPPRDEWPRLIETADPIAAVLRKIESLERMGAEVMTIAADVTDEVTMAAALDTIRARFGAVNEIIHAAGGIADEPLLAKSAASASTVIDPKVRGTLVLERTFASEPLKYFILCSSVSSILAPAGQVDYAAANSFLDAFAQSRSSTVSYPVIALQYPRWTDVGMAAANHDERRKEFTLDVARDWIVREHRMRTGTGLFPGTGYVEMILNAVRELAPSPQLTIHDLQFKRPLEVAPGEPRQVRTQLRRKAAAFEFTASIPSVDGWSECASARISVEERREASRVDLDAIRRRCISNSIVFAHRQNRLQEKFFDFGPRWNALDRIDLGQREALAAVELVPDFHSDLGEHSVHPALLDMATGAALFLIPGYEKSGHAYVPMGYGRIRVLRPLPARCYSHLRARDGSADSPVATFDIDVLDAEGNHLVEIGEFALRRIEERVAAASALSSRSNLQVNGHVNQHSGPRDRIDSSEGVEAFRRILVGQYSANIVVFPSDFAAYALASRPEPTELVPPSGPDAGEGMRDEVETTIAQWWRELLGAQTLTPQSDFFEAGGQSLTAVRLFAKIKKNYGVQLSPATIYEARTIAKLAYRIRDDGKTAEVATKPTIVPIRSEGSKPPLFVFPDMNGTVIGFDTLVRSLPNDLPVYGAESTWLTTEQVPLRLEEMAARHLKGIRALQKHGPYFLLGYSFGGLMAFEIAQQLLAAGEKIGMLGMLDTWQIGHIRHLDTVHRPGQKIARRARKALTHLTRLVAGPNRYSYFQGYIVARLRRELGSKIFSRILPRYMESGHKLPPFLRSPNRINMFAAERYAAQSYAGRITMFRAAQGIGLDDPRYGESLGWQSIAQAGVEIHEVPGTHRDMLREPNVQILAREVGAAYKSSETKAPSRADIMATDVAMIDLEESSHNRRLTLFKSSI